MSDAKCLLVGTGTLECNIGCGLLGWSINSITLIDSGVVRFSHTVKQCPYTYEGAKTWTKEKTGAAVERLREIDPNIVAAGYDLHHPIGETVRARTEQDLDKFVEVVQSHDVVFMLTDSKESRWLSTLLGTFCGKIVINAAFGFGRYLITRHRTRSRVLEA